MAKFFIDRPIFAWVIALFIIVMGAVSITQLPVAQYPPVAPPAILISTAYPGASAQTLEDSVLSVIEREMNGAPGLIYMESVAQADGSGSITITFEPGTNEDLAQVEVQNRLSRATSRLPAAVTQQGVLVDKARDNFLLFTMLSSDNPDFDTVMLGDYAARNIQPELQRVKGIGKVQLFGSETAMRVWIDPTKLQGADDQGRPRLFMPNPVQGGSSGSHYDTAAAPNLLMEPAINDSLYSAANLDITPHLLADIGWQINAVGVFPVAPGNAKVGSPSVPDCDTGVPIASQSGMFTGGSIQASNEVCLLSAQTRSGYYSCMDAARDRLVASSLLTTTQGQKMMMCAKRVQSHQQFPIF